MPQPLLPICDLATPDGRADYAARLGRLRETASASSEAAETVAGILDAVRTRGDDALVEFERRFTDPGFTADRIRVSADELAAAEREVEPELLAAIQQAIEHVRDYQAHILPTSPEPITLGGAELGLRFSPVDSAGLYVPGGSAVLFSTLVMLAVPAQVAGVATDRISIVHPPPTRQAGQPARDISPVVLATCHKLGLTKVYRLGGAQAVAALACGTESVEKTDFIAGPGNVFVQLAKAKLAGQVGIDGFYGPSEVITLADASADPKRVAADLLAQAEHAPGKCFLVVWERPVLERIEREVEAQLARRSRAEAIRSALASDSAAVVVENEHQAADIANEIACEHVSLAVADPDALLSRIRHGGEIFLGDATPVAAGDYYAGPSHCLPTGTTARFTSGISVYTFLKRTGTVAYRQGIPAEAIDHIAKMAEAEGLDAHADSVRARRGLSS
ncbi:MAG: histidinol dehydrogenase [Phycisphaeraceae bacterium]